MSDEKNASLEAVFVISVIDEFRPIVRTGKSLFQGDGTAKILAEIFWILADFPESRKGVSSYPRMRSRHSIKIIPLSTLRIITHPVDLRFWSMDWSLERDITIVLMQLNAEGVSYGASQSFETPDSQLMPKWSTASPVQGAENWWQSPWFGSFFMGDGNGWIMHEKLGWLFVLPQEDSVWLWQDELGWLWTAADIYPYLYRDAEDGWIFFHGGK